jgi:hypothetical protein
MGASGGGFVKTLVCHIPALMHVMDLAIIYQRLVVIQAYHLNHICIYVHYLYLRLFCCEYSRPRRQIDISRLLRYPHIIFLSDFRLFINIESLFMVYSNFANFPLPQFPEDARTTILFALPSFGLRYHIYLHIHIFHGIARKMTSIQVKWMTNEWQLQIKHEIGQSLSQFNRIVYFFPPGRNCKEDMLKIAHVWTKFIWASGDHKI